LDLAYPRARNADNIDKILQHLVDKELVVVESIGESPRMMKRWAKMVYRGWQVVSP
jgi:hypothetical protein